MDSRDIKEEPRIDNQFLESMFIMQEDLIKSYVRIESIPAPPIDINTKKSQSLIKDFSARIIEELSEGFESYEAIFKSLEDNQLYFNRTPRDFEALVKDFQNLQNLSEELSDAIHFYLELLIYVNIGPSDILSYIEKFVPEVILEKSLFQEILEDVMDTGAILIKNKYPEIDIYRQSINQIDLYQIAEDFTFKVTHHKLKTLGSVLTMNGLMVHQCILWDITHHINIARNFLKNKPWKQTQMLTQESAFQGELVLGFIILMGYLKILGGNPELVYYIYFKKNLVNRFRIESKY